MSQSYEGYGGDTMNFKELLGKLVVIAFASGTIGVALKFLTFQIVLNQNLYVGNVIDSVWFPYFPNVLDSIFLIISALYLAYRKLHH